MEQLLITEKLLTMAYKPLWCWMLQEEFAGCCSEECLEAPRLLRPPKQAGYYGNWTTYRYVLPVQLHAQNHSSPMQWLHMAQLTRYMQQLHHTTVCREPWNSKQYATICLRVLLAHAAVLCRG